MERAFCARGGAMTGRRFTLKEENDGSLSGTTRIARRRGEVPMEGLNVPDPHPADDVLLELGRLVWAAMRLEEVVYTVCRSIQPRHGPSDDHPIGARIDEA